MQGPSRVSFCLASSLAIAACVAPDVSVDRKNTDAGVRVDEVCRHYQVDDEDIPAEVVPYLKPSNSIRVCHYSNSRVGYELFTRPERGPQGACYTTTERLFRHNRSDGTLELRWWPEDNAAYVRSPVTYYALDVEACPDPEDVQYVFTQRISEGVFILLWRFWERVRLSRTAFVSSVLPPARGTQAYEALVEVLPTEENSSAPLPVQAINFVPAISGAGPSYFEILVGSPEHGHLLCADVVRNGDVMVTCVSEYVQ